MEPFTFSPGRLPLLVSMPHVGTTIPDAIADALLLRPLLRSFVATMLAWADGV